jgi:predicted ATPase
MGAIALFAEMLSLANDGRYPVLEITSEQRRQRTSQALISQVQKLTHQSPVLMIFEDAHWSDPTSLEVFSRVVDRIATLNVLLIMTFRPEFDPLWIGRPHVTALFLTRLTRREIDAMIDRVIGNKPLPASVRQDIIERTDGIPLFVEEMTKAVLEAESETDARRCSSTRWCKTLPTAPCCENPAGYFTLALPRLWKVNSRRLPRTNRSCWPVTVLKLD